jgi:predicted lipoprotein with Yx(FWY)xxD motif
VTRVATFVAAAVAAAGAAVVVVVLATRSPAPAPAHRRAAAGDGAAVGVARTRLGRILVDARGHTLYLFLEDRGGRSACGARCARVWPPVIVSGRPRVEKGVIRRKLTTTRRADGRRQLIYNGHPLYTLTADTRPGQIRGQGFLGAWYVVSPAGHQVGGHRGSLPADY